MIKSRGLKDLNGVSQAFMLNKQRVYVNGEQGEKDAENRRAVEGKSGRGADRPRQRVIVMN